MASFTLWVEIVFTFTFHKATLNPTPTGPHPEILRRVLEEICIAWIWQLHVCQLANF